MVCDSNEVVVIGDGCQISTSALNVVVNHTLFTLTINMVLLLGVQYILVLFSQYVALLLILLIFNIFISFLLVLIMWSYLSSKEK